MLKDDVRKTVETAVGNLTPARAQELARGLLEPGTAKDQVAKVAADVIEWSQRNRERLRDLIRREIQEQVRAMGVATQPELDALKKRVRELERAAGMTASGRARSKTAKGTTRRPRSGGSSARKRSSAAAGSSSSATDSTPSPEAG